MGNDSPDLVMDYAASMVSKICGGTFSKIVKFELIKISKNCVINNLKILEIINVNSRYSIKRIRNINTWHFKMIKIK